MENLNLEERLRELSRPTLIYRRERADMVEMFKIMEKINQVHIMKYMKVNSAPITRGHCKRIEKRQYNYNSSMNSFVLRATNPWNALPSECIEV